MSKKTELFVLRDSETARLLAYMETPRDARMMLGAVDPASDYQGNYYSHLIVCGSRERLEKWWKWAKDSFEVDAAEGEYEFEVEKIKVCRMVQDDA